MGKRAQPDLVTKPKCNPPLGELPVLQYCAVEQLKVDDRYQRSLEAQNSIALVRRIAAKWDWGLCQPLYVARRADGGLYVVDGQHRWAAAKLRGDIWQLPCVVRSFSTTEEEAAAFVALNQERTPLTAVQMFRAAVASGNEESCGIMATVEEAGLSIATTTNNQQCAAGSLTNIAGLRNCWRVHGRETLLATLRVLGSAYRDQVLRYAGTIFPGVVAIVAPAVKVGDPELIGKLADLVGARPQDKWVSLIMQRVSEDPTLNRGVAAALVFKSAERGESPPRPSSPSSVASIAPTSLRPAETAWCDQCDQRVSGSKAARCTSPFCKVKAAA